MNMIFNYLVITYLHLVNKNKHKYNIWHNCTQKILKQKMKNRKDCAIARVYCTLYHGGHSVSNESTRYYLTFAVLLVRYSQQRYYFSYRLLGRLVDWIFHIFWLSYHTNSSSDLINNYLDIESKRNYIISLYKQAY